MADDADSKSVGGNAVWVQVPLPALPVSGECPKSDVFTLVLGHFLWWYRRAIAFNKKSVNPEFRRLYTLYGELLIMRYAFWYRECGPHAFLSRPFARSSPASEQSINQVFRYPSFYHHIPKLGLRQIDYTIQSSIRNDGHTRARSPFFKKRSSNSSTGIGR